MADPRKPRVVDGFTTMKAAQEAAKHGLLKQPEPSAAPAPPAPGVAPDPAKIGSRIGRTVLPSRTEIVCPGCGHTFELTGKNQQTVCVKCRARLPVQDWKIEGEWDRDITTAGTVTVQPGGCIRGGTIVCNNLALHGRVEGGQVRVTRQLQLHAGCAWPESGIPSRDLWVGEGVEYTSATPVCVRNADVRGRVRAQLRCEGLCTVRAGGCVEGALQTVRAEVEDGAGLLGAVEIRPGGLPPLGTSG